MGLLERAGVNVGPPSHRKANVENPGGFYEVAEIERFTYGKILPQMKPFVPMMKFDAHREWVMPLKPELMGIFAKAYKDRWPIAVKDMHMAMLPMFETDPDIDVRVVFMKRKIADQALSIEKVWRKPKEHPAAQFVPWLNGMYVWADAFMREFRFNYLTVDFDELVDHPLEKALEIYKHCDINAPDEKTIKTWVHPEYLRGRK